MDLRQFCKLYRDITKQLRYTHSITDEDWEKVDCDGEVSSLSWALSAMLRILAALSLCLIFNVLQARRIQWHSENFSL